MNTNVLSVRGPAMSKLRRVSKIQPVCVVKEQQECFVMSTSKLKVLNLTEMEVADATLGFC